MYKRQAYRYAKDYDFQTYNNVTGNIQTENTEAKLNEQTASFYPIVDLDVPILQGYSHRLNLLLDALFNGRQDVYKRQVPSG